MQTDVVFSSKSNEWETPLNLFKELNERYKFTLDPASTDENHKCKKYFTQEDDGLKQSWEGETVFCNPPYGREIGKWVGKASKEKCLTVMLLPARTDTKWFHDYIYNQAEVHFLKGRLKFSGCKNSAPFPSMIVIFDNAQKE